MENKQDKSFKEKLPKWLSDKIEWCGKHIPELVIMIAVVLCVFIYNMGWLNSSKTYMPTTAYIVDSIRHYPPVVRGGSIEIKCIIKNTGDNSLVITDIQPANQSIELESAEPKMIAVKDSAIISFVFNTDKIVGYTQQKIRFYGNIKGRPNGMMELVFDTHIVRPAGNQSDYEDIYFDGKQDFTDIIIDGELGEKGYTTDNPNKRIH